MQRLRILPFLLVPCLSVLCLPDTALGQNSLVITDQQTPPNNISQLTFNVAGGSSQQTVVATANVFTTLRIQTDSASNLWLKVNGAAGTSFVNTTPSALLTVSVSTVGLAAGTYNGYFDVSYDNGQQLPKVRVNVQLNLTGSSALSANPPTLAFTGVQGSGTTSPTSSLLMINSSTVAMNYTLLAQTQVGNWLQLSSTSGTTGLTSIVVSANTTGLAAGTYSGTITASSTTTLDTVAVSVTLTITSTSTLTITPANPPPFLFQIGGSAPASQSVQISSSTTTQFSVSGNASWLVVSPLSGVVGPGSPLTLTIGANPTGLFPSAYDASITITPFAGNAQQIPVRLVVSTNPLLTVNPNSLVFTAGFSGQPPATKTVQISVTGSGNAVGFGFSSNQNWLSAIASQNFAASGSPATLTVGVNQSTLAVGTYN